jgi:RNA polymerase sigma-70 factor (ECF subfamily)
MINDLQCISPYWGNTKASEVALVYSAQAGDLDAFNSIVLRHQDAMFRAALRILGQEDLADDATQEAFISAYHHIHSFRGGSLKAWMMRIVINKCYDLMRSMRRSASLSFSESLMEDCEENNSYIRYQDSSPSVEDRVESSERDSLVQVCLRRLADDYRIIIALVDMEEMSYSEVSSILKIPMGTVKSRLARARYKLREALRADEKFELNQRV